MAPLLLRATRPHALVAAFIVNNNPETMESSRRRSSTASGWCFVQVRNAPRTLALMLRSIAAHNERGCVHSRGRCDASRSMRAHSVARPHPSRRAHAHSSWRHHLACALLRMSPNRVCHPISQCQTANLLRSRGASSAPGGGRSAWRATPPSPGASGYEPPRRPSGSANLVATVRNVVKF
jgi:hypothetical protein